MLPFFCSNCLYVCSTCRLLKLRQRQSKDDFSVEECVSSRCVRFRMLQVDMLLVTSRTARFTVEPVLSSVRRQVIPLPLGALEHLAAVITGVASAFVRPHVFRVVTGRRETLPADAAKVRVAPSMVLPVLAMTCAGLEPPVTVNAFDVPFLNVTRFLRLPFFGDGLQSIERHVPVYFPAACLQHLCVCVLIMNSGEARCF